MHIAEYRPYVGDRGDLLSPSLEALPVLTPCVRCSSLIKKHLIELTVGVGNQPWFEPEWKLVGMGDQCLRGPPSSGMAAKYEPTIQRCESNWMEGVRIPIGTHRYLEEARKPYTPEQVERVVHAWTQLVRRAGGFANAGIQIQELRTRGLPKSRETIGQYSYLYPAISDQVM